MRKEDLTGVRFGKLVVLKLYPYSDRHGRYWLCRCECGQELAVRQNYLTSGHTQSCGSAGCRQRRPTRTKTDSGSLVERLRSGTWLPNLRDLMNEAADVIEAYEKEKTP